MGNCIRREPSKMVWAGEDWESLASSKHRRLGSSNRVMDHEAEDEGEGNDHENGSNISVEKQSLLSENRGFANSLSSSPSTREVKIKITKKELEELLQRVDMQGLSLEQVLAKLIDGNQDHHTISYDHQLEHQRSWRPVLQSIPEVN